MRKAKRRELQPLDRKETEKAEYALKQNLLYYFSLVLKWAISEGILDIEAEPFSTILDAEELTEDIGALITSVYKDELKHFITTKAHFKYPNLTYLLNHAVEISSSYYQPTTEAVLLARLKSTGIQEVELSFENSTLVIVDIGGQRSERRKWINCFSDVVAVIYVAALDDYDQVLEEDGKTSRFKDSMDTFRDIIQQEYFNKKKVILFLNRYDLFEQKIKVVPLDMCLAGASTDIGQDVQRAKGYIKNLYREIGEHAHCNLTVHTTCALDTTQCSKLFTAIMDQILTESLLLSGLF